MSHDTPPLGAGEISLNFCKNEDRLGLGEGNKFFPFAYNWLQDNRQTAKDLAKFIREQDKEGDSHFVLIAHSMGGLVSRLMLLDKENRDIAEKTKLLFQIATPIRGSVKAYRAIKNSPISLFSPFDKILKWWYDIKEKDILNIKESLEKCPSLYQLLPLSSPDSACLYDENGTAYSTTYYSVWDKKLHSYIKNAIAVNKILAPLARNRDQKIMSSIKIHCIYSDQHKTPIHYIVKPPHHPQKFEVIKEIPSLINGDGTVTCASAIAYSPDLNNHHLIQSKPSDHLGICHNEKVYAILKSELNKLGKS